MVVGDDELHAREAAGGEVAEEGPPGGLVLAREGVEAEDLTLALAVDGGGDDAGTWTTRPSSRTRRASASSHT